MFNFVKLFSSQTLEKVQNNLVYIFILFLPTQFGKHFWLEESLRNGYRVDYLTVAIYFLDILVLGLVFLLISSQKWQKPNIKNYFFPALILIQALWSKTPINHAYFSLRIIISLLLVYFSNNHLRYNHHKVNAIFFYQSIFLFLVSITQIILEKNIGGFLYFFGERSLSISTPGISLFNFLGETYLRPYATFSHPNALAGYSLIVFFYTLLFNNSEKTAILTKILLSLTILLTFSQNAWFFYVLFLLINHLSNNSKQCLIKFKLTIFLSLLIPFLMILFSRLKFSQDFEIRNFLFENGLKNNFQSLLLGGGWFSDIVNIFENNTTIKNMIFYQPIHHSWWFIILSIGILPLIAFFNYFKNKHINKNWLLIFGLIIATGTLDHYWITQIQNYYLLIFLLIDFKKRET